MVFANFFQRIQKSTKLEKRAEQVLPKSEDVGGRKKGQEGGGKNGPNNVCIHEYMNKEKKKDSCKKKKKAKEFRKPWQGAGQWEEKGENKMIT
jgi:hypothetical protein